MPGDEQWFEESGDELRDDEFPDEDDSDDELTETVPCPECGAEVYEDSDQCPACGSYLTHDTSIWSGRSLGWIILGLAGIVAAVVALGFLIPW